MSDTPHLLIDCQRSYGAEDGLRIYNYWRDVYCRILLEPSEIKLTHGSRVKAKQILREPDYYV